MAESCDKVPQSGEGGEEGGSVADVQAHAVLILLACACDSSYRETRETSFNNQQTLEAGLKGQWRWANEKLSSKFAAPFAYWSS